MYYDNKIHFHLTPVDDEAKRGKANTTSFLGEGPPRSVYSKIFFYEAKCVTGIGQWSRYTFTFYHHKEFVRWTKNMTV